MLIVDDEPIIRDLLKDILLAAGFDVGCTKNGVAALEILAAWSPDVVLLDLMMPVMDGFACACTYRSAETNSIIMSAAMDAWAEAATLGASGWIQKPFDVEEILELVAPYALGNR